MMKIARSCFVMAVAASFVASAQAQSSGEMCKMCASGTPANAELVIPFLAIGKSCVFGNNCH